MTYTDNTIEAVTLDNYKERLSLDNECSMIYGSAAWKIEKIDAKMWLSFRHGVLEFSIEDTGKDFLVKRFAQTSNCFNMTGRTFPYQTRLVEGQITIDSNVVLIHSTIAASLNAAAEKLFVD